MIEDGVPICEFCCDPFDNCVCDWDDWDDDDRRDMDE